jgi:hypothetical protein
MNARPITFLAALLLAVRAVALDITTTDGTSYRDVTITANETDAIRFTHSTGTARLTFEKVPASLRAKFFDVAKVEALRKQQADAIAAQRAKTEADAKAAEDRIIAERADNERREREKADAERVATAERQRLAALRETAEREAQSRADIEKFRAGEAERAEQLRAAQAKADAEAAEKTAQAFHHRALLVGLGLLCFLPTVIAMLRGRTSFVAILVLNIMPAVLLVAWLFGMASHPFLALAGILAWWILAGLMAACWLVSLVWSLLPDSAKAIRRAA